MVLPLITIQSTAIPVSINEFTFQFEEVLSGSGIKSIEEQSTMIAHDMSRRPMVFILFLIGTAGSLGLFVYRLSIIIKLTRSYVNNEYSKETRLIRTNSEQAPFSFFGIVVIPSNIQNETELKYIVMHEKMHSKKLHSLDVILMEILLILQWFNPFAYLIKKSMHEIHEFEVDQQIALQSNHLQYADVLLNRTKFEMMTALGSNFNQSLTSKRIKMIINNKEVKAPLFKGLIAVFIIASICVLYAFKSPEINKVVDINIIENNVTQNQSIEFCLPLKTMNGVKITARFGEFMHPIHKVKKMHNGIDLAAKEGTEIIAPADGIVREAKYKKGYGNYVIIDHDDSYSTLYSHLQGFSVEEGDKVTQKEVFATIGNTGMSTGPHLHFSIMQDGIAIDPETVITELSRQ
jgi:beta-lactamase regulating signal transducer with metallopeptidase domain